MISGTVTLANTRLSLVDGTAFVDFSAAGTLIPYLNGKLTLTDSAGKKAVGYLKSGGAGETFGDNVTNANFADGSNWTTTGTWVVGSGVATFTGASGTGYLTDTSITPTVGGCYLMGYTINSLSGGANHQLSIGGVGMSYYVATGTYSKYGTATATNKLKIYAGTAQTSLVVDNIIGKQLLTPSITGVTITSTRGGTTYNWESVEAGFNYNDASGYTYEIASPRFKKSKFVSQYNYFYRRNR